MKKFILTVTTLIAMTAQAQNVIYCRDLSTPDGSGYLNYTKYEQGKVGSKNVIVKSLISKSIPFVSFTTLHESVDFGSITQQGNNLVIASAAESLVLENQSKDLFQFSLVNSIKSDYPPFEFVTQTTIVDCTTDTKNLDQLKIETKTQ